MLYLIIGFICGYVFRMYEVWHNKRKQEKKIKDFFNNK